ncbi:DUF2330 domain-containing protein [Streptomyces reniochalinae]|uniref:DUF2330 domain-containing protein n=1 Tax=Streptomyces reniochalinae TaxID=2250578 RepID=A0A367ERW7_9ACTN|nr:DUF2330 domain-containing protein [Streptomyces reniochalinae]
MRRGRGTLRALALVLALLGAQTVAVAWPAYACGCGAMVPADQSRIGVNQETSAVRWDGHTEQIVMRLTVHGDAEEAAWIMPVPHRASVRLGESRLFDELAALTAPRPEERPYFWPRSGDWPFGDTDGAAAPPGAAAQGPGVDVVGRERLGPFDVARLAADDPDALRDWLRDNGFRLPPRVAGQLAPYVERNWEYVAVRLAPGKQQGSPDAANGGGAADGGDAAGNGGDGGAQNVRGRVLSGALQPLHLTFSSDRLVYPMRLSHAAREPQSLGLYILAPHRMETRDAIGGRTPEVTFADRLETADQPELVRELADGDVHLTALQQSFPEPEKITGDHVLRRAASDSPFHRTYDRDVLLRWGGVPAWTVTVGGALLLVLVVVVALLVRRGRRRNTPPRHPACPPCEA